jgi:hypothetical protein
MKKIFVCIMAFAFLLTTSAPALAKASSSSGKGSGGKTSVSHSSSHSGKGHNGSSHGSKGKGHSGKGSGHKSKHGGHYYSSSTSTAVYLVSREVVPNVHTFKDCVEHSATSETVISHYSNGTTNSYTYYTVFDAKGNVIASNCTDVQHIIYDNVHYLLLKNGGKYGIYSHDGFLISNRNYTTMYEIAPNRLLVRANKMYGVIDLLENTIVPIKYKEFKNVGKDLYITKLNGYYGMVNSSNYNFFPPEYDKISQLYDTFVLKKFGKYGLADAYGNLILEPIYDKIKKQKEFIVVKKDKKWGVLDSSGRMLSEIGYEKIRINRNHLEGKINGMWIEIPVPLI